MKEPKMIVVGKQRVTLYVDRSSRQWVVLDLEGDFWVLPSVEDPWEQRQPLYPTEETEFEPVPGHYKFEGGFLGLDNIGVFDRSAPLPTSGYLEQADGTA